MFNRSTIVPEMEVDKFATLLTTCEAFAWAIRKRLSSARRRAARSEGSSPTSLTHSPQLRVTAQSPSERLPGLLWRDFWMNLLMPDLGSWILVPWQVPWLRFQRFPIDVPWWLSHPSIHKPSQLGSNFGHVLAAELATLIRYGKSMKILNLTSSDIRGCNWSPSKSGDLVMWYVVARAVPPMQVSSFEGVFAESFEGLRTLEPIENSKESHWGKIKHAKLWFCG